MTELYTASIGSYPRIGEEKDQQRHRRALAHLQNREISAHAFRDVEQSIVQEVLNEQFSTGIDELTDGLISWHDPISHFASRLGGFKSGGLARYFDTNFYYRVPQLSSAPRWTKPILVPEFEQARPLTSKPVRMVMTGPYTLARHSVSLQKSLSKFPVLLAAFTTALAKEAAALAKAGAPLIQIDEPAIARHPEDIPLFEKSLLDVLTAAKPAKTAVAFFLSPLAGVYDKLKSLPADVLHFDFTFDRQKLFDKILIAPPKTAAVGFGFVDALNTRADDAQSILQSLRLFADRTSPATMYLTPSAGLEFLPREIAAEKLKFLASIKSSFMAGH